MRIDTFQKLEGIRINIGEEKYRVAIQIIEKGGYVIYDNGQLTAVPAICLHTPDC